jgi:hypothetical protein
VARRSWWSSRHWAAHRQLLQLVPITSCKKKEGIQRIEEKNIIYMYTALTIHWVESVRTSSVLLLYFIISLLYSNCLTTLQAAAGAAHRSRAPSNCLFIAGRMEWKWKWMTN